MLSVSLESKSQPPSHGICPFESPREHFSCLGGPCVDTKNWELKNDALESWIHANDEFDVFDTTMLCGHDPAKKVDGGLAMHGIMLARMDASPEENIAGASKSTQQAMSAILVTVPPERTTAALSTTSETEWSDIGACTLAHVDGRASIKNACVHEGPQPPLQSSGATSSVQQPPVITAQTPGPCSKQVKCSLTTFSRRISSKMSLRLMNIPKAMHKGLGLANAFPMAGRRRSNRCTINVRIPGGWTHPVTMTSASGSYHRRLTEGWAVVCWVAQIRIGDTVQFCRTERHGTLEMTIARA